MLFTNSFRWKVKGLSHTYHVFILPQTSPSLGLPYNIEQSSMYYPGGPCCLSIFKYSCVYMSTPNSETISSPQLSPWQLLSENAFILKTWFPLALPEWGWEMLGSHLKLSSPQTFLHLSVFLSKLGGRKISMFPYSFISDDNNKYYFFKEIVYHFFIVLICFHR